MAIPPEAIGNAQHSAPIKLQIKISHFEKNGSLIRALIEKIIRNQYLSVKKGQQILIQVNPNHIVTSQASDFSPLPPGMQKDYSKCLEVGTSTQVWIKPSKTLHNVFEVAAGLHSFGPDYEHFSPLIPEASLQPAAPPAKSSPPH